MNEKNDSDGRGIDTDEKAQYRAIETVAGAPSVTSAIGEESGGGERDGMTGQGGMNRRNFFRIAGLAGAATVFSGSVNGAEAVPKAVHAGSIKVPTRRLGRSGIDVPMLSLGGSDDLRRLKILMKQATAWGITLWDTSPEYANGNSEIGIGEYLSANPGDRGRLFIQTKTMERKVSRFDALLGESLGRLKTDYVDSFLLHGISNPSDLTDEVRAWADRAKKAGKIRLFGFSSHSNMEECLIGAAKKGWPDLAMFSYNYRLARSDRMQRAIADAHGAGIGMIAIKWHGRQTVTAESVAESKLAASLVVQGFTPVQALLKAVWDDERIASICATIPTFNDMSEYVAAALGQRRLTHEDKRLLNEMADETDRFWCSGCANVCEPVAGFPVADVLRALMYANSYGDIDRARAALANIPTENWAGLTPQRLQGATDACPRKLNVVELVHEARNRLA